MTRVLIADDHVMIRNGLVQLFDTMDGIAETVQAADGAEVLAALSQGPFGLLVLDLTMPEPSGINLIERIRADHAKLPILVLSMHDEVRIAKKALQAGANGFVTKGCAQDTLMTAIRKVLAGERFIDSGIVEHMMFDKDSSGTLTAHQELTEREHQILALIAKGRSGKEIAEELLISDRTVSTHKVRLMRKLGVTNNADLIRSVSARRIVD